MEFLSLVTVMFSLLIITHEMPTEKLVDILVYPKQPHKKITKRQVPLDNENAIKQNEFYDFVEEKLIQHSQALEHLLKLVQDAADAISALAENVSQNVEEPKLPEKIEQYQEPQDREVPRGTRRSGDTNESPRTFEGEPSTLPLSTNSKVKDGSSQWCSVAVLCHRTMASVCGYDDNFGYGKFDDLCHLLKVNCFWKYNFSLVPNCRPTF